MNILCIDCSNGLNLMLCANKVWYKHIDHEQKKQSDNLLEKIDDLLGEAKLDIKKINVIAVCVGPGSFTGIRVAISTAKGLAIGSGAKIVTFSSFDTIKDLPENNYAAIVDGFGNNYYYKIKKFGRVFEGCNNLESINILLDGIKLYTNSKSVYDKNNQYDIVLAEYDATKIVASEIEAKKFILTNQIAPLYLRASQAEIERQKNGNKV